MTEPGWEIEYDRLVPQSGGSTYTGLCQAIEAVAGYPSVGFRIVWCGVPVHVAYAYELTDTLHDLFGLLEAIGAGDDSFYAFELSCDEPGHLDASFEASWSGDEFELQGEWRSVMSGLPQSLQRSGQIRLPTRFFVNSWLGMLGHLRAALAGVALRETEEVERIDRLLSSWAVP